MSRQIIMLPDDATNFGHVIKSNFDNTNFYRTKVSPNKELVPSDTIFEYDKDSILNVWAIEWHTPDWIPNWKPLERDKSQFIADTQISVSAILQFSRKVFNGQNIFCDHFEYFSPCQATSNYAPNDKHALAIARKFIRLVEKGGSRWDVLVDMATLQPFGEPTKKDRPVSWPAARQSCIDHPQRFLGTQFDPEQQKTFGYKPVEWLEHLKR